MRGAKAQAIAVGPILSNTFEIGKFPRLGSQIRARRTRTEWRYQHGEKMEHDDYFWQNDFVWASDSHAGIGITETAILGMAAVRR